MRWYILLAFVSLAVLILTEESEGWWRRRRSSRRRSSYRPPPRYYRRRSISYTRRRRSVSRGCGYLYCYNGGTKYCAKGWWTSKRKVAKCSCRSWTSGKQCQTITCPRKSCNNGGTNYCKSRGVSACRCRSGFYGPTCTGCPPKSCYNGGTKYCTRGGFLWRKRVAKCRCKHGWSGHDCRIGCPRKTCYNGGTRYCKKGGFLWRKYVAKCKCAPGWYGHDCRKGNGCPSKKCFNGGKKQCYIGGGFAGGYGYQRKSRCNCIGIWGGDDCRTVVCNRLTCLNGGRKLCFQPHMSNKKIALCRCSSGTRGTQCQIRDGQWGNWSSWKPCSLTCGDGSKKRERQCNNPTPANGGRNCIGQSSEKKRCNLRHCPIDGEWSRWSQWKSCNRSCGGGFQTRMRECDNPKPAHGGRNCTGQSFQERRCNPQSCPRERIYVRITFKTGGKFPGKNPTIRIYGTKKTSKPLVVLGFFQPGKSRNETKKLKADLGTLKKIEIVNSPNIIMGWKLKEVIIDSVVGKKMKRYYACFKKGERVYSNKLTTKKLIKGPCPIIKPDIVVRVTFKTGRKSFGYNPIILINGTKGTVKLSFARTFNPGTTTTVNKTLNADLGTLKSIHVMNIVVINGTNVTNNSKLKAGNSTISMSNSRGWDLEMVSVQFVGKKNEVYRACFKGTPIFNLPIKKNLTKGNISC